MIRWWRGAVSGGPLASLTDHARTKSARSLATAAGDRGATMVEYAFLIGLIALIALASAQVFGLAVGDLYDVTVP